MTFCPKCRNTLTPRREDERIFLSCRRCDYSEERNVKMENAQQGQVNLFRIDVGRAAVIPVIEEEKKYTVKHHCTKCDNDDAYFRELREDRFSDEQSGGLYTCTRCGETEKVQ